MEQGFAGGKAWFRPRQWAVLHAAVGYEGFTIADGQGHAPDVDTVFTPDTAPGLGDHPDFLHLAWSAAIDTRDAPGYTRRGALLEIAHHVYRDRGDVYNFERLDAEVIEHIPFFREAWVLSLRGRVQTTLDASDAVPFFLMPALGSGSTLRGYSSWRFRDRHSALFSAEWRWMPNRMAMDAALFYDAGTVADRFDALSIGRMESNVGFGVRFHSPVVTPLRIEVAWGRSGPRLIFSASSAF
jgi:outer membrane protein assembly factor BamA